MITMDLLKPGMKIKLRDSLEIGRKYGSYKYSYFVKGMKKGIITTVLDVYDHGFYIVDDDRVTPNTFYNMTLCFGENCRYIYQPDMIEKIYPEYKYVICSNCGFEENLTVGKIYRVLEEDNFTYKIYENDKFENAVIYKSRFTPVENLEVFKTPKLDNNIEIKKFEDIPLESIVTIVFGDRYICIRDIRASVNVLMPIYFDGKSDNIYLESYKYSSFPKHNTNNKLDIVKIEYDNQIIDIKKTKKIKLNFHDFFKYIYGEKDVDGDSSSTTFSETMKKIVNIYIDGEINKSLGITESGVTDNTLKLLLEAKTIEVDVYS